MWKKIQEAAAAQEMRPSEFMRRILENHLLSKLIK
jgi:hypothetical protein